MHDEDPSGPPRREGHQDEHVLHAVLLEGGVLALLRPQYSLLPRGALAHVDGIVLAHARHGDAEPERLDHIGAKVDEFADPLVQVRGAGARGLVRDKGQVEGLAVVGDDAVALVEGVADLQGSAFSTAGCSMKSGTVVSICIDNPCSMKREVLKLVLYLPPLS